MSKYTPTKRGNPCEICGNTSGKCRTSEIDFGGSRATLHLCMDFPDDADAPDFKYLGQTKDGLWGKYVSVLDCDRQLDSEAERERWRREQQLKIQQRKEAEQRRHAESLSEAKRDKEIRKILGQLSLSDAHREHLKRDRGFSDEEIVRNGYRSIEPFQKLDTEVSHQLAGVSITGRSLTHIDPGIICPIPNPEEQFVGWQLRRDADDDKGKSRWAKSKSEKRPNGATSHLQNGELPLGFYRPTSDVTNCNIIGLTEGVGFKPSHTAQLFGQIVIGASGGNFSGSPETFKRYLDFASEELGGVKSIALYADAGAVSNRAVLNQYRRTHELVRGWGYTLQVAWWGQIDKTAPDGDELQPTDIETVKYISWDEFWLIACDRASIQQNYYPALNDTTTTQAELEEIARIRAWDREQEIIAQAQEEERERQRKQENEQKAIKAQKKLNNLNYPVNILLHDKYLPNDLIDQIPHSGIVNLKARKGGGKSTLINRLIAQWKSQERPVISITPRIALGREQAFKWDITWIDECGVIGQSSLTSSMLVAESTLGLCWDSFWKVARRDWTNAVIIIDEAELGLSHLATSSTCENKRAYILKEFEKSIKATLDSGGLVILSDADLTDISCDYIRAIAPAAPVFTIYNTHQGEPWDIEFYFSQRGDVISRIELNLLTGIRTAVATDSQAEAEALERRLIQHYPNAKIVRIDSTVTETAFGQEFVKDPNQGILDTKPDLLIYTPSMGVGVSIEVKWFEEAIGLFFGALEPSQCRQMLARIRAPIPRIIYCTDARHDLPGCKSFLPEVIKRQMLRFHKETSLNVLDLVQTLAAESAASSNDVDMMQAMKDALESLWDRDKQEWNNPHINLYCNIQARRNFGMSQLAVQLYQELVEEGHHLTCYEGEKNSSTQELSKQKIQNRQQLAAQIASAERIDIELARSIKNNPHSTQADKRKAERAFLQDALPGVELTKSFIFKAAIENRGRWLSQQRLFWRMMHPDKVMVLDEKTWLRHLSKSMVYLPDVKTYSLQVQILRDLGIPEAIAPGVEYCHSSPVMQQLQRRAYAMRRKVKVAFDINVNADSDPIKLWGKLLEKIGLATTCVARHDNVRYYAVCETSLTDPDRIAVLEALDRKYRDLEIKQPETVVTPSIEACQIPPVIVNNREEVAEIDMPLVSYAGKLWHVAKRQATGLVGLIATAVEDANQWMRERFRCDLAVDASLLDWQPYT